MENNVKYSKILEKIRNNSLSNFFRSHRTQDPSACDCKSWLFMFSGPTDLSPVVSNASLHHTSNAVSLGRCERSIPKSCAMALTANYFPLCSKYFPLYFNAFQYFPNIFVLFSKIPIYFPIFPLLSNSFQFFSIILLSISGSRPHLRAAVDFGFFMLSAPQISHMWSAMRVCIRQAML